MLHTFGITMLTIGTLRMLDIAWPTKWFSFPVYAACAGIGLVLATLFAQ